jgi:transcriptional regulator with XRE-family HTH domain
MPHNPLGALPLKPLGEYIREQRRSAQYSVRQLAQAAGVSNPYLSQIERGLRKPSAEILQQLARALQISAETLYVRAGLLDGAPETGGDGDAATGEGQRVGAGEVAGVREAVAADPWLSGRQKRALLDIYDAFRAEGGHDSSDSGSR